MTEQEAKNDLDGLRQRIKQNYAKLSQSIDDIWGELGDVRTKLNIVSDDLDKVKTILRDIDDKVAEHGNIPDAHNPAIIRRKKQ